MNEKLLSRLGKRIREIRQTQQIKLQDLASGARVSKGLVSRIENGRTIPSLPVLIAIIEALNVDMGSFFEGLDSLSDGTYIHRKKADYEHFEKEDRFGFDYQMIMSQNISNVSVDFVILNLLPGSKREKVTTNGFEFKYILSGEVEYHLGDEIVAMEEGDSLFFNARIPHVPVNRTGQTCAMLVIYFLLPEND